MEERAKCFLPHKTKENCIWIELVWFIMELQNEKTKPRILQRDRSDSSQSYTPLRPTTTGGEWTRKRSRRRKEEEGGGARDGAAHQPVPPPGPNFLADVDHSNLVWCGVSYTLYWRLSMIPHPSPVRFFPSYRRTFSVLKACHLIIITSHSSLPLDRANLMRATSISFSFTQQRKLSPFMW